MKRPTMQPFPFEHKSVYPARNCGNCGRLGFPDENDPDRHVWCTRFNARLLTPVSNWCCKGWKHEDTVEIFL